MIPIFHLAAWLTMETANIFRRLAIVILKIHYFFPTVILAIVSKDTSNFRSIKQTFSHILAFSFANILSQLYFYIYLHIFSEGMKIFKKNVCSPQDRKLNFVLFFAPKKLTFYRTTFFSPLRAAVQAPRRRRK